MAKTNASLRPNSERLLRDTRQRYSGRTVRRAESKMDPVLHLFSVVAATMVLAFPALSGAQTEQAEPAAPDPEAPVLIVDGCFQPAEDVDATRLPDGKILVRPRIIPIPPEQQHPAAAHPPVPQGYITPNFRDADLAQVAKMVTHYTGKQIIVEPGVCGQVNYESHAPIPPEEFYPLFLTFVHEMGLRAVEEGEVTRIVPDKEPGSQGRGSCRRSDTRQAVKEGLEQR